MINKIERDYRRHIWMVQARDTKKAIAEKTADGVPHLIQSEWRNVLKAPVWGSRAVWHAMDMESDTTVTRVIKVAS